MSKTQKKQSARKPATKRAPKPKFDTEAFVFDTPIEKIEEALQRFEEQEADPMAEPLTQDQLYWFGWWTLNLPDAKRRGLKTVPTCAKENGVLKIYEKTSVRKRNK